MLFVFRLCVALVSHFTSLFVPSCALLFSLSPASGKFVSHHFPLFIFVSQSQLIVLFFSFCPNSNYFILECKELDEMLKKWIEIETGQLNYFSPFSFIPFCCCILMHVSMNFKHTMRWGFAFSWNKNLFVLPFG